MRSGNSSYQTQILWPTLSLSLFLSFHFLLSVYFFLLIFSPSSVTTSIFIENFYVEFTSRTKKNRYPILCERTRKKIKSIFVDCRICYDFLCLNLKKKMENGTQRVKVVSKFIFHKREISAKYMKRNESITLANFVIDFFFFIWCYWWCCTKFQFLAVYFSFSSRFFFFNWNPFQNMFNGSPTKSLA